MRETDNSYRVSDPFFSVECAACGAAYWSTRRQNAVCAKCGAKNPHTNLPEHIRREMEESGKGI